MTAKKIANGKKKQRLAKVLALFALHIEKLGSITVRINRKSNRAKRGKRKKKENRQKERCKKKGVSDEQPRLFSRGGDWEKLLWM